MLYRSRLSQICKFEQKEAAQAISLAFGLSCLGWLYLTPAYAQIVPDNTLGAEQSILIPGVDINGSPADLIQGGAIRGTNLFHSFLEFNVGTNQRVYFADPGSISRIVGRVTGNNASFIDGTLGVVGNADLYLFNPNGIAFGPNAQLDINGSFLASTANGLDWGNGLEFNATNPQAPPLLTIDLPVSLNFAPGNTSVLSSEGQLTTGADLTLAAERLELQGSVEAGGDLNLLANQQVQIRDSASQPFNATAQGDLLIQGDQGVDIFTLNHPDSWLVAGNNLTLRSNGDIIGDARFWSSGNLAAETSLGQNANIFSPNGLIILAGGDVTLADYVGTPGNRPGSLNILAGGSVSLGDVTIGRRNETDDTINSGHPNSFIAGLANYTLSDSTSATIDGSDGMVGEATLDIRAGIDWTQVPGFSGNTILGSISRIVTPTSRADITVGNVNILPFLRSGGQVSISNQYFSGGSIGNISTGSINTRDTNGGGIVVIDSNNQIVLGSSPFGFSIRARPLNPINDFFDGGDIQLLADDSIFVSSQILADGALGGNINIRAGNDLTLGANLSSVSNTTIPTTVQGGDINITTAGSFVLGNGASINTSTNNYLTTPQLSGPVTVDAGSVNITALDDITFRDGAEIISASFGPGRAGDITVRGNNIYLIDSTTSTSTQLVSKALAQGNAGNVTLTANNQVLLDQGYIFASTGNGTSPPNNGNAGTVTVNANRLTLNTDPNSTVTPSFIAVDSQGAGRAGSIIINTLNGVTELIGANVNGLPSAFVFNGFNGGGPGDLEVNTRELLVQGGALISGNAGEQVFALPGGERGRIDLNASERIEVIGSSPSAPSSLVLETSGGLGAGDFVAFTQQFLILDGGNVSAQSIGVGDAGTLQVNANQVRISGESNGFRSRLFFESQNSGQAGGVDINANQVVVDDRGLISVSSTGTGSAGNLSISSGRITVASGGEILAQSTGADAGNIAIASNYLTMLDGGTISASSIGANGGNITFNNQDSIVLGDRTNIEDRPLSRGGNQILATVQGDSSLSGGIITFNNVRQIDMMCCDNTIAAAAELDANGGNIFFNFPPQLAPFIGGGRIDSPGNLTVNNDVLATAESGNGGFVQLNNFSIFNPWYSPGNPLRPATSDIPINYVDFNRPSSEPLSEFTARSISGNDGTVEINPIESLEPDDLPSEFLGNDIEQSCATGGRGVPERSRNRSTFSITGNGGLPPGLDTPLGTDRIYVPLTTLPSDPNGTPAVNTDHPSEQTRAPLPATPCQPLNS